MDLVAGKRAQDGAWFGAVLGEEFVGELSRANEFMMVPAGIYHSRQKRRSSPKSCESTVDYRQSGFVGLFNGHLT